MTDGGAQALSGPQGEATTRTEAAAVATDAQMEADDWPLDPADFPGCQAIHIPEDAIEEHDGRLEYWEAQSETAMVVAEPATRFHERPSHRLAGLARLISASRGSFIEAEGTTDLVRFFADGRMKVLMQADQILYLQPPSAVELSPRVDVDSHNLPDVVLEVDHSTDARVRKLPLYEAWGFPEVWVEVPDRRAPSRSKSRAAGLTIHLLEGGRFRTAPSSRAFPGWTADEIHRALNEHRPSQETTAVLRRVGRALGAREGTGPDDDPWLRHERDESRAEGRAEGLIAAVAALLEGRGVAVTGALKAQLKELEGWTDVELMRAAQECASVEDLVRRLRG